MKIFVPGRICLFGEHSDWAGGYRRINADDREGLHAHLRHQPGHPRRGRAAPDRARAHLHDAGRRDASGPYEIPLEPKALLEEAQRGGFFSYAAGVAYQVLTQLPRARPGHRQLPDRPADQEGPLLERRDLRPHRARLQPRLRPAGSRSAARWSSPTRARSRRPRAAGAWTRAAPSATAPVLMEFDGDRLEHRGDPAGAATCTS